jgi:hypothetical protein
MCTDVAKNNSCQFECITDPRYLYVTQHTEEIPHAYHIVFVLLQSNVKAYSYVDFSCKLCISDDPADRIWRMWDRVNTGAMKFIHSITAMILGKEGPRTAVAGKASKSFIMHNARLITYPVLK